MPLPTVVLPALVFMELQNNLSVTMVAHTMSLPNNKYVLEKRSAMGSDSWNFRFSSGSPLARCTCLVRKVTKHALSDFGTFFSQWPYSWVVIL